MEIKLKILSWNNVILWLWINMLNNSAIVFYWYKRYNFDTNVDEEVDDDFCDFF